MLEFYQGLLNEDSTMDEPMANAMMGSQDFIALLRACLADIESEKTLAYSSLAISIATGKVGKQWRRHFILTLQSLSLNELNILKSALISKMYPLIPSSGSMLTEGNFIQKGSAGSFERIAHGNLTSKGLIDEDKLSSTGDEFTKSCFKINELTPNNIGYNAWSGKNVAIICYQIGDGAMNRWYSKIEERLRENFIKSSTIAVTERNKQGRLFYTQCILLIGDSVELLNAHSTALARFSKNIPMVVLKISSNDIEYPKSVLPQKVIFAIDKPQEDVLNDLVKTIMKMD